MELSSATTVFADEQRYDWKWRAVALAAAMVSQMIALSFYEVASSELSSFWFAWI